jgi:hypothetical protein
VYVADSTNNRIEKFDGSGTFSRTWGWGVDDGTNAFQVCTSSCQAGILGGGAGQLDSLTGLATDSSSNVYAGDFGNNRIQRFSPTGSFIDTWGKGVDQSTGGDLCTALSGHTCGAGSSGSADGQFSGPAGLSVGPSDVIYVADQDNARVQKFNAPGAFAWKSGTLGSKGLYGTGLFLDVATGPGGKVFTSHAQTNEVQQLTPLGASLRSWGAFGTGDGEFDGAVAVAVDDGGGSYVVDESNSRIEQFDSGGTLVRMWGWGVDDGTNSFQTCTSSCEAGIAGSGDGQFNDPMGIGLDSTGNVYVADTGNDRVQKFTSDGNFQMQFGAHGAGNGQFNGVKDVAVDSLGFV